MDHLPLPGKPTLADSLRIPYLSTSLYDGGPFADYPARHGWQLSIRDGKFSITRNGESPTRDATAAFLQTWLYFGLLSEALGCFWKPEMQQLFVEEGDKGERWLSTQYLEGIVVDWVGYMAEVSAGMSWKARLRMWRKLYWRISSGQKTTEYADEVRESYDRFQSSMKLVQTLILYAPRSELNALGTDQVLGLMALGVYLCTSWWKIYRHFHGRNPELLTAIEAGQAMTKPYLQEHMLKMNWCPSDISRIMGKSSSNVIWYYANMQPPRAEMDHSQCKEVFCSRNQINSMGRYQLAHATEDCECHLVQAKLEDLREVLAQGGIPVLNFEEHNEIRKNAVSVHKGSKANFVAISHIWAEGLGDPDDNALHNCQVKRLFNLIGQLPTRQPQSRYLWIDTMCVPVYKKDQGLHKKAMQKMRDTYESATEVLVLDAYVQDFKIEGATPLEAFARVVNSSWMQRLWTLQEGRLAQRVYFQFADGPVELRKLFNSISHQVFPSRAALATNTEITMSYRASKFHTFEEQKEILKGLYEGIIATRDAVMSRGLSKDSDEALCLSTLMDLDPTPVINAPDNEDEKMRALWAMIPKVPLSLVFSRAPKKLPIPGFRWAPSSFRGPIPHDIHDWWAGPDELWKRIEAEPTPSGLLVKLPGLFLRSVHAKDGWSNALDMGSHYIFQLPDGRWIGLGLGLPWSQPIKDTRPEKSPEGVALILQDNSLTERVHEDFSKSTIIANDIPSKGLLVGLVARVKSMENNEIHVAGLQHAQVMELPPDVSTMFSAAVSAAHKLWDRLTPEQPNSEVVKECIAVAKEAMLDPTVLDACRNQRRGAGADESDDEIMYMIAEMAHNVYLGGFNTVDLVPESCKWYVD
ncbi:hypothetical protein W97_06839 [Coniosporium apollinis CBS 100218]|uniref:Heterokaryon incompatibility domain-containing protein n=1 Tax=Coniosporium apollinis (strain CBS 100218) TaxID=1168221 RepID=R7Z1B5_CONA1|nr:uncharacterized protein W97_06839 [Coniosporium apollinis CBS 100218]EON67696.1 hypothetical protein W97_06839 [Coniosporium apollinis CBS 100218]